MIKTRYEEYTHTAAELPFIFYPELTISSSSRRQEANWHDNLEIQICLEGNGTVMLNENLIPFVKDDIMIVNSTVLHYTGTSELIKCRCLIIDTQFCKKIDIDPTSLQFESKIINENLLHLFDHLASVYNDHTDVCRIARMNSLLIEILIELRQYHTVSESAAIIRKKSFETVKNTIKFIRNNYHTKLSLDLISKNVYMDKYTLSQEFKKITNQTIIEYLNHYRCNRASDYISNGASVSEAARLCGFTNMSFFTKTFKQYMGCLPSQYK